MLHDDFRAARLAADLTVTEVARRAGVPRKAVQTLESGANVTLETVRKIASVIPNLTRVTLGGVDVIVANVDLEEARTAALDLFDVARRLVSALGASPGDRPHAQSAGAAGAVRHIPSASSERATAERLERMVLAQRGRPRKTHES